MSDPPPSTLHPPPFTLTLHPSRAFAASVSGARVFERVRSAADFADPLLEVDAAAGERSYIRKQPHGRLFVTRDPADTIYFPTSHPRSGQPRYRWEKRPGGIEIGYLVDGAAIARREGQA